MSSSRFDLSTFALARGREPVSEDFAAYKVTEEGLCIAVLCDGVGSARAGAEAARRTVRYLINNFSNRPRSWCLEKSLRHFIGGINSILYREGMREYDSPEYLSTLSIVVIEGDRLYGANVGDSPIWLLREGRLRELSIPHRLEEEGMEHVITQAIGLAPEVDLYFFESRLEEGDRLILASDGLERVLSREEIGERAALGAGALVRYALKKSDENLPDDTTALVIGIRSLSGAELLKMENLPVPGDLDRGEVIDGYRLIRALSPDRRTWLTEKKGVKYVLKFPDPRAAEEEEYLDLFVREAWNAARLKAGFFPKAVIPRRRSVRYYVMQHLKGPTLEEAIARKALPVEEAVALGRFLLHGAQYLLRQDLVHGDIKPENILLLRRRGKRVFRLIDFGSIVEIFSTASQEGTPSYLAPERFTGEPVSEPSEIFAIGVTLYRALSGRYPYGEIEPFQTPTFKKPRPLRRHNPLVPEWLEAVVMRAIERDQSRRYQRYSEMEYELTHPEKVRPPTTIPRRPSWSGSRSGSIAGSLSSLLCSICCSPSVFSRNTLFV